jgi:hypothetical protein
MNGHFGELREVLVGGLELLLSGLLEVQIVRLA